MKVSTPSLIFYFLVCALTIFFSLMGDDMSAIYAKSIVVPSIFIYFFIENNYRLNFKKAAIFFFSFIGEIYYILDNNLTEVTPMICFMLVYILLISMMLRDLETIKFIKEKRTQILILVLFISVFILTILNLKFEDLQFNFSYFIVYGIVLGIVTLLTFTNFILKPSYSFFNLVLMSICFVFSDVFYLINNFYFPLTAFKVLGISTQVFSYYFMVQYFKQPK
ncbi:MAG: hypothetical protein KA215_01995 [Flavobacterium sp.]|jgi:hypothetical protein|nr:hypothetical protein [Flavobacterium sp.]